jgi:hypothetical protein
MSSVLNADVEERRKYLENRARLEPGELARYAGQWIAWSPDGTRIVAHSEDPGLLDDLVLQADEDPERCIVEGIPKEDALLGGQSLGPVSQ